MFPGAFSSVRTITFSWVFWVIDRVGYVWYIRKGFFQTCVGHGGVGALKKLSGANRGRVRGLGQISTDFRPFGLDFDLGLVLP